MKFKLIYFTLAVILATVSGCQQQNDEVSTQESLQINASNRPKQKAYIDPETGEFISRPTNLIQPKSARSRVQDGENSDELEVITSPNGTITIKLDDRFKKQLMATKGCDGKLQLSHQDEAEKDSSKCVAPQEGEK